MTTTEQPTAYLDCPAWCRDRENGIHRAGEDDLTIWSDGRAIFRHFGPRFGDYAEAVGEVDILTGQTRIFIFCNDQLGDQELDDPAHLSFLAADLTTAAKWLEAHQ